MVSAPKGNERRVLAQCLPSVFPGCPAVPREISSEGILTPLGRNSESFLFAQLIKLRKHTTGQTRLGKIVPPPNGQ